jgi:hypothetical protein
MECNCTNVTNYNKELHVSKYLLKAKRLYHDTSLIIIYSKLAQPTDICINTVIFSVVKGLNKICICRLRKNNYNRFLKIAANVLCTLEEIPTLHRGVIIYVLKGFEHKSECINSQAPTLLDSCFFALFLDGITNGKLLTLVKRGILPQTIYERRLKMYSHLGFFNFKDIFCLPCPIVYNYRVAGCEKPTQHLQITI